MNNPIVVFLHCEKCMQEQTYAGLAVGFTAQGQMQIWCEVHNRAVGPRHELKQPPDMSKIVCGGCKLPMDKHGGGHG
jgi:hypothetical protein